MTVDEIIKDRIAEKLKYFLLPGQKAPQNIQVIISYDETDARLSIDARDILKDIEKEAADK